MILKDINIKEYTLITTYRCNWDCSYCVIDTHKRNREMPISFDQLKHKIDSISPNSQVCLSGGEVGLLTLSQIEYIFLQLKEKNCNIDVLTNGLFIEKYFSFIDQVDEVHYHCVIGVEHDIQFPDLPQDKFIYLLVVTNENVDAIDDFMDRYPLIRFKLCCNSKKGETLTRQRAFKLFTRNKHRILKQSFETLFSYNCEHNII